MDDDKGSYSRRQLLEMAAAFGGFALAGSTGLALAGETKRDYTRPLTTGPFYPKIKPLDQDADLTIVAGRSERAQGQVIHLTGRVLNADGEPVGGARIEIWQANAHGRYAHPSDPNTAPLDPNFQGYAVQTTDGEGRFHFKTIKPGAYPGARGASRTPHIHVDVGGKVDRLVTQMFFPNEQLNDQDHILQAVRPEFRDALVCKLAPPTKGLEADSLLAVWDVVLARG